MKLITSDMTTHGIAPIPAENDPMYTCSLTPPFILVSIGANKSIGLLKISHLPLYQQQPGLGLLPVPCREPWDRKRPLRSNSLSLTLLQKPAKLKHLRVSYINPAIIFCRAHLVYQ